MQSVENGECGKCGVRKMHGVENAGCENCRVWKIHRKFQFSISISGEMQRNSVLTIKKKENRWPQHMPL